MTYFGFDAQALVKTDHVLMVHNCFLKSNFCYIFNWLHSLTSDHTHTHTRCFNYCKQYNLMFFPIFFFFQINDYLCIYM